MKQFELFFTFIRLPLDYAALIAAAISAYVIRLSPQVTALRKVNIGLDFDQYLQGAFAIAFLWVIIFAFAGLYTSDPNRKFGSEINRILIACSAGFAAVAVVIFLRGELFNSRFIVLAAWVLSIIYVTVVRLLVRVVQQWLHSIGIGNRRIIIVGSDETATILKKVFDNNKRLGSMVANTFSSFSKETANKIKKMISRKPIHEMIFTNEEREDETLKAVTFCEQNHITFKYAADLFSTYAPHRSISVISSVPIIELKRTRLDGWGRIIKRLADIFGSIVLLVIALPFMAVIAIAIVLETGRPIIFKNERVGSHGKKFEVLKFRSMYQKHSIGSQFKKSKKALQYEKELIKKQSDKHGPVYKIKDDPRVTGVGRFIRRWSLDELPQLFNVLSGSMSLVGPRPHQPREVANYKPHHTKVLAIKPGMTGLAQISGRSDLSFEEEMKLDTYYIENWSLATDVFVLLKTPLAVISTKGAW